MAIISLGSFYSKPKKLPKAYKARDAAYVTGGNRGAYIAALPRPYPINAPQRKVREIAAKCGIHKGIKKADLQTKMVDCVGPAMRK